MHRTRNAFPSEGFEIGLGHACCVYANEVFAPRGEVLEVAGGLEHDHFGIVDIEAEVCVHQWIVDGLDAVLGEHDFDGACF